MKGQFAGILMLLGAAVLYGQETDYQRYDLVRKQRELVLESTIRTWAETVNGYSLYTAQVGVQGEYTFLTHHTVTVRAPYTVAWYNQAESRNPWLYSLGDLRISYEYLKQFGHINLFVGPRFGIPLGEGDAYAAREGVYAAGSGRYSTGLGVSVRGIRDPVVWQGSLSYEIGLPKEERFYTSLEPGNIQASGSFSDVFNERFGFSVGLTQTIKLPELWDGSWDGERLWVSTTGTGEFMVLFEHDYIRFSGEATLYPVNRPFVLGITYGHQFELSKD
jgi:hypothetical protein